MGVLVSFRVLERSRISGRIYKYTHTHMHEHTEIQRKRHRQIYSKELGLVFMKVAEASEI